MTAAPGYVTFLGIKFKSLIRNIVIGLGYFVIVIRWLYGVVHIKAFFHAVVSILKVWIAKQ